MFWYSSVTFFELHPWTENHIHMLTYSIVLFYLLLGCLKNNFGSFSRGQPQSLDVNHYVFIIFWLKSRWELHKNESLKTWNGLPTDPLTDTKANWRIQKKIKNHTYGKKVEHISEILFGIYWWTWKINND